MLSGFPTPSRPTSRRVPANASTEAAGGRRASARQPRWKLNPVSSFRRAVSRHTRAGRAAAATVPNASSAAGDTSTDSMRYLRAASRRSRTRRPSATNRPCVSSQAWSPTRRYGSSRGSSGALTGTITRRFAHHRAAAAVAVEHVLAEPLAEEHLRLAGVHRVRHEADRRRTAAAPGCCASRRTCSSS